MKKNGDSGKGKGSNGDQKKPKFVDTCSVSSLRKIGEKMGYTNITGELAKDNLIKRLLAPKLKKTEGNDTGTDGKGAGESS